MNKKIILIFPVVVIFIIGVVILTNQYYSEEPEKLNGPGVISVERYRFQDHIAYIKVTPKMLIDLPPLEGLLKQADSDIKEDPATNVILSASDIRAHLKLENEMAKKIKLYLEELSKNSSYTKNIFYLQDGKKYYYLQVHFCDPGCPSFM